jgi:very-short-patch-repair endonuclease
VDGGQHSESKEDIKRTQWLSKNGYGVVRFWNHEVERNIEGVLEKLQALLVESAPHPDR